MAVQATVDQHRRVGTPSPGFSVMENLLVAAGGAERGGLEPFDLVRSANGRPLRSGRSLQAEVGRHPPGTPIRYLVYRRGALEEVEVRTRLVAARDFHRFLVEGLLGGALTLALAAVVWHAKPGLPQSWLFLAFGFVWFLVNSTYADAHSTYRLGPLFRIAWGLSPALFIHLALSFPQRRSIVQRLPWIVWAPYGVAILLAGALVLLRFQAGPALMVLVPGIGAVYWLTALVLLILSLARTSVAGATAAMRQRARVLAAGFALGYLPPVLGTTVEALLRVPVPGLNTLWKLNFLFPVALAYAMARYDLFDVRSALRTGTVYSVVTGLVVAVYAGTIALLDLLFGRLEPGTSPLVPAVVLALAVVLFLNPVYVWAQRVVDRVFFRPRVDVERSVEHMAEVMTGLLDLAEIDRLLRDTVERVLHPVRHALWLHDPARHGYVSTRAEEDDGQPAVVPEDSPLAACLGRVRAPVTRERHEEDPSLGGCRASCLPAMDGLECHVVVPILFHERVTGFLTLGPKRAGTGYTTEDLRLLRTLTNQSAVALEHARAYAALAAANAELTTALRRVELLEHVKANLVKFVPRTVQTLIEQAPEAPALDRRDADVSVLFVDIAGYTRLAERLEPARLNELVERYFGTFLDEVLRRGGDVNETAGDGLMAIFQQADSSRHARAAVRTALAILGRARELNLARRDLPEPIALHLGINSGVAAVGATKIEGVAGTRWTYTAAGQVTNVAARLATLGEDAIIVGPVTRARLGPEFELEELGERSLKNVEHPVRVFRLVREAPRVPAGR